MSDKRVCDAMERRKKQTVAALERSIAEVTKNAEAAEADVAEREAQRVQLEAEAAETKARCEALEQEKEQLKAETEALNKQKCQVCHSKQHKPLITKVLTCSNMMLRKKNMLLPIAAFLSSKLSAFS